MIIIDEARIFKEIEEKQPASVSLNGPDGMLPQVQDMAMKITKKYEAVRRCPDRGFDCDKMAKEKLKHFVSKEALNIDGLGKK